MKRALFVLLGAVLLVTLLIAPSSPAHAQALCVADPGEGPVGTVFVITCTGFLPNTPLNAYLTEPDGATVFPQWWGVAQQKTDATGTVVYTIPTLFEGLVAFPLGTWWLSIEEYAGGTKVDAVAVPFTITGDPNRTVAGALLSADRDVVVKGQVAVFTGMFFLPGEKVDVWLTAPNGECSSQEVHLINNSFVTITNGLGTFAVGQTTADATGTIQFGLGWFSGDCEGQWTVAARGVTSGFGAYTMIMVTGKGSVETALLTTDKPAVRAMSDSITFFGTAYLAGENVNCWNTSPQGAAFPVGFSPGLKANALGDFEFTLFTGVPGWFSEGALGTWAMTCKGMTSGLTGIAYYEVFGGVLDP